MLGYNITCFQNKHIFGGALTTLYYAGLTYEELASDAMLDELLPRVVAGGTVLDLGIAAGHAISPLAFTGLSILGVDTNKGALKFCQQEFEKAGMADKLRTHHIDAMQFLDTNTEKFDVVSLSDFLMFFAKTKAIELIKSAYDAVKDNGLIWIVTKSTNDLLYDEVSWMQPIEEDTFLVSSGCHSYSMVCFFRPGEVDEILSNMGAEVLFSGESVNRAGGLVNTILAKKVK